MKLKTIAEGVYDNIFAFHPYENDPDNHVLLHHDEQCYEDNYLDLSDDQKVKKFIFDTPDCVGFILFDGSVKDINKDTNSLDYEPVGMIYLNDETHLVADVFKKIKRFLETNKYSMFVEPVFI